MIKKINFDMDGTIANLYGVENWLDDLIQEKTRPYDNAKPLVNLSILARQINRLQKKGFEINIISWLSKNGSDEYNARVTKAKEKWLKKHLPSVTFNKITIVEYGTPKYTCGSGILFDDEEKNRKDWKGIAFDVNNIIEVLRIL